MYSRLPKRPYVSTGQTHRENAMDRRGGVYIPLNYSGTAIDMEQTPTPHFDDLPQVSQLSPMGVQGTQPPPLPTPPLDAEPQEVWQEEHLPVVPSGIGRFLNSRHFPFGHGLGFEELFLLGLILLLLHEEPQGAGEGDDLSLTLLLVGALLFCG